MGALVYPFDSSGTLASNKITNEQQILPTDGIGGYLFIVPFAAPFFKASMKIYHIEKKKYLVEGVDFSFTHFYKTASASIGKAIYGSITFYNTTLTGAVQLQYQTIGGEWLLDHTAALEMMANKLLNPRITYWETVVDAPAAFPVIEHDFNILDMVGMTDIKLALDAIKLAINAKNSNIPTLIAEHIINYENPHKVTATMLGLGNVKNYTIATNAQALEGAVNDAYMTPVRVKEAVINLINVNYGNHFNNHENPHQVNKLQVGLGNVQNYGIATSDDAITGASNVLYMTPLRVKEAVDVGIAELTGGATGSLRNVFSHLINVNNPHKVTKAQVGLSQVQNFGVAADAEAILGTDNGLYMTPYLCRIAIENYFNINVSGMQNSINNHIAETNAHGVTKTTIGLGNVENFTIATTAEAQAGVATNAYMTPALVKVYVDSTIVARNGVSLGNGAGHYRSGGLYNVNLGYYAGGYNGGTDDGGGDSNVNIGYQAGMGTTSYNNTIAIGSNAVTTGSDQAQIGNSSTTTYVYGTVQNRSDIRDKSDVVDSKLGIDFILGLRAVEGVWNLREDYREVVISTADDGTVTTKTVTHENDGSKKRSRKHQWFIAQEVKELCDRLGVDFGGYQDHSINGGGDVLSLGYDEFIPPAVKAIQQCWARLDDFELRLMQLEETNKA